MNALSIVEQAIGPAFVTDSKSRVLRWNAAARSLFHLDDSVVGKPLHAVLNVRDGFGNRLAFDQMPLFDMVARGEPIQSFELHAGDRTKVPKRFTVSVVLVLGQKRSDSKIVYLLQPIMRRRRSDELIDRLMTPTNSGGPRLDDKAETEGKEQPRLTRRQNDVLRLLAEGRSNEEIAKKLNLSVFTVRSHVQTILAKLGVHSKLEAVSRAFRDRLI